MSLSSFDIQAVRARFPALAQDQIYFDNAGGSQTLDSVIDSIRDYLTCTNVQLGATYKTGLQSTSRYNAGHKAAAKYINCAPSELLRNVSYSLDFDSGDMIISEIDHEANIASWLDFAKRRGLAVKWWKASTGPSPKLQIEELRNLLTENTRLVTCSHASNILGTINDIKQIASEIHSNSSALLCVDAVAYAPHRPIDVQALGVDFYVFSWYKVYGPHISMLFANERAQARMQSLGHFFNPTKTLENKIGLAGASYELAQAIPAVTEYLGPPDSTMWQGMIDQEHQLQKIILEYLNNREDVTVFGETSSDPAVRVPTISFVVKGWKSKELVEAVESISNIGFRWGSFYSNRLVATLLESATDGVVRVSMVHYNIVEEANYLVSMLDQVLSRR